MKATRKSIRKRRVSEYQNRLTMHKCIIRYCLRTSDEERLIQLALSTAKRLLKKLDGFSATRH